MTRKPNPKQAWVADIEFVVSECVRFNELLARTPRKEMSKRFSRPDFRAHLPSPTGQGHMICGVEALRRIRNLAALALSQSEASGSIEPDKVYEALKRIIVQRFFTERRSLDPVQIERALAAAVREVKRLRADAVHFIPCRLMYAKDPRQFSVGPVTFREHALFDEEMAPRYAAYPVVARPEDLEIRTRLLVGARHYYEGFTWVAEVKVLNCDPFMSEERAHLAVSAAVDFLHLLFGAYYTDLMAVAGPRMADDQRAHFYLDAEGSLQVSHSFGSTSAVGFPDGWGHFLESEHIAFVLRTMTAAIEPIVDPSIDRPIAMRLVDAASWFGQAVREASDAARIVKAVTALERLVMTDEQEDIQDRLCQRAAAISYDPTMEGSFDELTIRLRTAYGLRSRLAHGSLSPFDPEVTDQVTTVVLTAERAIRGGLSFFAEQGLLHHSCTRAELAKAFEQVIAGARNLVSGRRPSSRTVTSDPCPGPENGWSASPEAPKTG